MTMNSQIATTRISRLVREAEHTLDMMVAQQANLIAMVAQARIDVDAPISQAQPAMMRLMRAQQSLLEVRAHVIRAHAEMLKVGQERGDIMTEKCPNNASIGAVASMDVAA